MQTDPESLVCKFFKKISMSEITIDATPGRLPKTWERPVTFFSNIGSLFFGNDGAANALAKMVGALSSYGGRLAPVLTLIYGDHRHLLVVDQEPSLELLAYQHDILGLPELYLLIASPENYQSDAILERIAAHESHWIDGFVTTGNMEAIAQSTGKRCISTATGSYRGNNKYLLHFALAEMGLPLFETRTAGSGSELPDCLTGLDGKGYTHAAVKAQIGASGIGLVRCNCKQAAVEVPEYLFFEGPCLVQGWMDDSVAGVRRVRSPSVQMFIDDDRVCLYDITEQILDDDSVHEGNFAQSFTAHRVNDEHRELLRQARLVGEWLWRQGYRGTGSVDFHVAERNQGDAEVRVCEVNARVTGATYPSMLARRFEPDGACMMRNLRFHEELRPGDLIERLDTASLLYRPGSGSGCLPINFNLAPDGTVAKGQFLFLAPTLGGIENQMVTMELLPKVGLVYDRD